MNDAVFRAAFRAYQTGNLAEAGRLCRQFLVLQPGHFNATHLFGLVQLQTGDAARARVILAEALKLNPRVADAWYNHGCALFALQQHEEALVSFDRALVLSPDYNDAKINRAATLLALRRGPEALECTENVLARDPKCVDAMVNHGMALLLLKRHAEAIATFDRVLALAPQCVDAHFGRGNALTALKRSDEALLHYDRAVALAPHRADILTDRGVALLTLERFDDGVQSLLAALKVDPDNQRARGNLLVCRAHACDWREFEEDRKRFGTDVKAGKPVSANAEMLTTSASPEEQLLCIRNWLSREFPLAAKPLWSGQPYRHDKIRIAYLSADLREHAVARQLAGVLEHRDKSRFETTALSFKKTDDAMRARLEKTFDRFIDVDDQSDTEVATLIRNLEIDIAVDLMGLMAGARPGILPQRPAPVQALYLGFCGTMGGDPIDYLIADRLVIPENYRRHYGEKIVYLPNSFMPTDDARHVAESTPTRREAGLPETGFVFCAFNNLCKVTPEIFAVWMRLLTAVPDSVLWLSTNPGAPINLRREAEAAGIAPERLVFAPYVTAAQDHLARMRLADLFLDTTPYNAHATTCDALWTGLPVLTLAGETFAGRVAASLLHVMGLPEMVTPSLDAYESRASALARDPAGLARLKARLIQNRATSPLFDTTRYSRHLDAAFIAMWERHARRLAPVDLVIPPG